MSQIKKSFLRLVKSNESGTVMIWSAVLIPLVLGMGGLTVDVGYAYVCDKELQMSTDAAALAAASGLPTAATAISEGAAFSASPGNLNAYRNLNTPLALTNVKTTVVPGCVTVAGLPECGDAIAANAVQVTQTTTIPTFFIKALAVFGVKSAKSITLQAVSTAVMRGAQRGPYDVAIVLDTTESMTSSDGGTNCNSTKIKCAEQGAEILLAEFSPCLPGESTCGAATNGNVSNAVDEVSLFTFPAQQANTQAGTDEAYDTNSSTSCSGGRGSNPDCPDVIPYPDSTKLGTLTNPPATGSNAYNTLLNEYQVVPLTSNYRSNDASYASGSYPKNPLTVDSSGGSASDPSIVNAVGGNSYFGGTGETGMLAEGGESTFFAGALFTAQQYLAATVRTASTNVIVLLSDGDANGGTMSAPSSQLNSNGTYPSAIDQCQQAISVASAAKAANTKIYVVGYGVANGGCETDGGKLSACSTLRQIASSDATFFVDGSSVKCAGATSVTVNNQTNTLGAIFSAIAGDLTLPRLVPNTIAFTAVKS